MKYVITEATNFLRVFQLPSVFPEGFCFGGAKPCFFHLTDWFNAFDPMQLWDKKSIEYDEHDPEYLKHIEELRQWIMQKKYFSPVSTYLIVTDYGHAFIVNPETRAALLQKQYNEIKSQINNKGVGQ